MGTDYTEIVGRFSHHVNPFVTIRSLAGSCAACYDQSPLTGIRHMPSLWARTVPRSEPESVPIVRPCQTRKHGTVSTVGPLRGVSTRGVIASSLVEDRT